MKVRHEINSANALILGAIVSVLLYGCGVKNPAVIAGTGTVLGVDISQNAAALFTKQLTCPPKIDPRVKL